jgi:hypothetical protein
MSSSISKTRVRSPAEAKEFSCSLFAQTTLKPTQPPIHWVPGVKRGRGVTLTTHPQLVPRSLVSRSYTSSGATDFLYIATNNSIMLIKKHENMFKSPWHIGTCLRKTMKTISQHSRPPWQGFQHGTSRIRPGELTCWQRYSVSSAYRTYM